MLAEKKGGLKILTLKDAQKILFRQLKRKDRVDYGFSDFNSDRCPPVNPPLPL